MWDLDDSDSADEELPRSSDCGEARRQTRNLWLAHVSAVNEGKSKPVNPGRPMHANCYKMLDYWLAVRCKHHAHEILHYAACAVGCATEACVVGSHL